MTRPNDQRSFTVRALLTLASPLLEKNPIKVLAVDAPIVFSLSHLILLGFACAMLRQVLHAGVAGWPEATVIVAIIVGKPIVDALSKVSPADVVEFGKVLLGRFGVGDVRKVASVYGGEPSIHDDHTAD